MKYFALLIICTLAITSCNSSKNITAADASEQPETPKVTVATGTKIEAPTKPAAPQKPVRKVKPMLLGTQERASLEAVPYGTWFNTNYARYTPATEKIATIKKGLEGITLTTFMGTWCGDSKRETPRMYKILDAADFDDQYINLITVDRSKQKPLALTADKNIKRVPTFIFMRDGKEIGRIVERPVESLEADMIKILNGESYKHAYEN